MSDTYRHHIPRFHISLPTGYLNDPNGPIEIDGTTHLYFQSRSAVDLSLPVHWGHATSRDLIHWNLHRPAMSPTPGGPDADGCWSGNTVHDNGGIRAYYSGMKAGSPYQSVLTAFCPATGSAFGQPAQVIPDPGPDEGVSMFRDPFVWRDHNAGWHMAVGCALPGRTAAIRHYRSHDGTTWTRIDDLARLARATVNGIDTGEGWECPQIVDIDEHQFALVSSWSHRGGPANVLAFPTDETRPVPIPIDDGAAYYAASVMRQSSHGTVLFGWVREERDDTWSREVGWSGAISLPRTLTAENGRISCRPHPALRSLRAGTSRPAHGARITAQTELSLPSESGTVRLEYSANEWAELTIDAEANTLTLERGSASLDPRAHATTLTVEHAFDPESSEPAVTAYIDGSILEIFTNSGRTLTARLYPTATPPWSIHTTLKGTIWDLGFGRERPQLGDNLHSTIPLTAPATP